MMGFQKAFLPTKLYTFSLVFPPDMCMVSCFTVRYVKYRKEHVCDHLLIVMAVGLRWSALLSSVVVEEDELRCPSTALCLGAAGIGSGSSCKVCAEFTLMRPLRPL